MGFSNLPGMTKGTSSSELESLLRRNDIWRGHSQLFVSGNAIKTGYDSLDKALVYKGWPEASLVEVGQSHFAGGWLLFIEAARQLLLQSQPSSMVVLVNPPALPYAAGLVQLGVPLDRLLILTPQNKADFIASFVEIAQSEACSMLLAWQPRQRLSYAELRKCQLATSDQRGLYVLFRHYGELKLSSPAPLRIKLSLQIESLRLDVIKQKGRLPSSSIFIPLPEFWYKTVSYKGLMNPLNQYDSSKLQFVNQVLPLNGKYSTLANRKP